MSCQYCGCDPEANHKCERHTAEFAERMTTLMEPQKLNQQPQGQNWTIKDSGTRKTFAGGMQRDVTEGKTDYLLVRDGPMFERWAIHLTNGAKKYDKRNWLKGVGLEELDRAKESATRHFEQYIRGDSDEDHAAAVFFNINQIEYLKGKL